MTTQRLPESVPGQRSAGAGAWRLLHGGTAGNARLTALAGLLLFVLLAAEGLTILSIRSLLTPHAFIGFLLIPPIGLKLASTGYRFVLYYGGTARYRAAGPPRPFPRILAPFLVAATILLFGSGVILIVSPPGQGDSWRQIHTLSFFVWFWLMSAHVLTHLLRSLSLARADTFGSRRESVPGAWERRTLVVGSIVVGVALAIAFLPWDSAWAHWLGTFRRDG